MKPDKSPQKRSFFSKFLRFIFFSTLIILLLGLATGTIAYFYFSKDIPKLDRIEDYKPPLVSEVFDADGKKMGEFWIERRFLTPINQIPKKMIEGFVASEDDRFFEHHGVDPWGIVRAMITNLKAGHVVQGGSTITQQVAKALVLSPERTYDRKIKEAIVATKIEANLTKEQILFLYLNQTFFGNRAYGVEAAAQNYFHKELKDLNVAEIAMIVGLSKAPSTYNPLVNPDRARIRQHYVIDRMQDQGYISAKEAQEAKSYPLKIYKADTDKDFNLKYTPYFTETVRRYIQEKYGDDALYKSGWKIYTTTSIDMQKAAEAAVEKGVREVERGHGYKGSQQKLSSSEAIDKFNLQNHIHLLENDGQVDRGEHKNISALSKLATPLKENEYYDAVIMGGSRSRGFEVQVGNAKGIVAPETTGWAYGADSLGYGDVIQVKLYSKKIKSETSPSEKSKSPKTAENKAPSQAADGKYTFSLEQQPSLQGALYSYEPFTGEVKAIVGGVDYKRSEFNRATQALRQPGSSVKPLIYSAALDKGYTPNTIVMDAPILYEESPGKFWSPKNYGGNFSGAMTVRNALARSVNLVCVRITMDIGTHFIDAYMRKLGLTADIQKFYSMALGANDVYLSDMARAYGVFANGGMLPKTYFVRKIVDPSGKVIEENKPMDPSKFVITWGEDKKEQSNTSEAPSSVSSKGEAGSGQASIPESQHASSESSPESIPLAKVETKPAEKSKAKKGIPWDEMDYNPQLIAEGEEVIKKDQLNLSEYEKKLLYGDYIPEGYVITPRTAATMVSMLQDVVKYGTATRLLALGKPAAGKTGTTNGATDAWFIGFTPTLVTGVWVGHDEKIKTIGRGATGGHVAAPIWLYYMTEATKKYPTKDFKLPPWIDLSQYQTPMEIVKGDTESVDFIGAIPGSGGGGGGGNQGSGAEFFTKDL